jgi:hypothetical protein
MKKSDLGDPFRDRRSSFLPSQGNRAPPKTELFHSISIGSAIKKLAEMP